MLNFGIDGSPNTDIVESAIQSALRGAAALPVNFDNNAGGLLPLGTNTKAPARSQNWSPTLGSQTNDQLILPPPRDGRASNLVATGAGDDNTIGTDGIDIIAGGSGNDDIKGGDGNDLMAGGPGDDVLNGGDGEDVFILSEGRDLLTGGDGSDRFVLPSQGTRDASSAPRIRDFNANEGDSLLLPTGINAQDLSYQLDADGNTLIQLPDGSILAVLEGVDPSELLDFDGAGSPVLAASDQLDDLTAGAKDLGLLSGDRIAAGQLSDRDNYDLFKFQVENTSIFDALVSPANNADVRLSLYQDQNGDQVLTADEELATSGSDAGETNSIQNYLLDPGQYYLAADLTDPRANNEDQPFTADYTLNLRGTESDSARDTAGQTFANAVNLGSFETLQINESLGSSDAADIYRIEVSDGEYFTASLGGDITGQVSIGLVQDLNGDGLVGPEDVVTFGSNSLRAGGLAAGSYYLMVIGDDGAAGSYQLDLSRGYGSPVEDEVWVPLSPSEPLTGDTDRQSQIDPLDPSRRFEDYYVTDMGPGEQLSLVVSALEGAPDAELIDPLSLEVKAKAEPVPGTSVARINFTIPDARAYAVRVYSPVDQESDYRLDLSGGESGTGDTNTAERRSRDNLGAPLKNLTFGNGLTLPAPQFIYGLQTAYVFQYRPVTSEAGLTTPGSTNLQGARITDIQQGLLGDCTFLAGLAATFGRVNPNPGPNSKARKPKDATSPVVEGLLKDVVPASGSVSQGYRFAFYDENTGQLDPSVGVLNALATPKSVFDFAKLQEQGADTKYGALQSFREVGQNQYEGTVITKKEGTPTIVKFAGNEFLKWKSAISNIQLATLDLKTLEAQDLKAEDQQTPLGARFPNPRPTAAWVPLVETGFAVWRGQKENRNGFDAIGNGGDPGTALFRLTGRKLDQSLLEGGGSIRTDVKDADLFQALNAALDRGDFISASTQGTENGDPPRNGLPNLNLSNTTVKIANYHAYAITDVYNAGTAEAPEYRVVIFNPHGWDGTVSTVDPKWRQKPYNEQSAPDSDGFVDLPLSDFRQLFFFLNITTGGSAGNVQKAATDSQSAGSAVAATPESSTLASRPDGSIAATQPGEFFTLDSRTDKFSVPTNGTGAIGKVRALNGNDKLEGSDGPDELYGNEGDDLIYGRGGDDFLWGGKGKDQIYGNDGYDFLKGQLGNDLIVGGKGNDLIDGGIGDDVLVGGGDKDVLTGGFGADKFALFSPFAVTDVSLATRVTDFKRSQGDAIVLTNGVTSEDLVLEDTGKATVIRLKSNNAILGVVDGVTPADLNDRFVSYATALTSL